MRRLRCRPPGELLLAVGRNSANPVATRRLPAIFPSSWRKRTTCVARAAESSQLLGYLASTVGDVIGMLSVWPPTWMTCVSMGASVAAT
ncbi:hypothetical protein D3C83_127750 [compost metagenome]